jgi:hypothetical protein
MAGDGEGFDHCEAAHTYPEVFQKGKDLGTALFHGTDVDATVDDYNEYRGNLNIQSKADQAVGKAMIAEFMKGMKCGDPVDIQLNENDPYDFNIDFTAESFVGTAFDILNQLKLKSMLGPSTQPPISPEQAASYTTQKLQSAMTDNNANDPETRADIVSDFNRLSKENGLQHYKASEENGLVTIQYVSSDL